MILVLSERFANAVLEGRKVEHRIPVKPGEDEAPVDVGDRITLMEGKTEKDPWSQKPKHFRDTVGHLHVTAVREQLLHQISEQEVRAEGFKSYDKLVDWWWAKHRTGPGRRGGPNVDLPVWVLGFDVIETNRFLAETPRQAGRRPRSRPRTPTDRRGYVFGSSGALEEELPAVDEATLREFARQAHADFGDLSGERERERRETWELDQRLRRVLEYAQLAGVDVSHHRRVILERVERMEKLIGSRAA